jgi:predicted NUDIX family NTP pyrophosphohydrolase
MKISAGILPYRWRDGRLELFLVHMGGPYWRNRSRAWSIVKGEVEGDEALEDAAKREFYEETGQNIEGRLLPLGSVKSSDKTIYIWAVEANPSTQIRSNFFEIEWPPSSGKRAAFPEVDKAAWFTLQEAKEVIVKSQLPFLERIEAAALSRKAAAKDQR